MRRRLYRSGADRIIWGVCGGIAEYFNIDPIIVRLALVLFTLVGGCGIIAYIICAIVIPREPLATEVRFTKEDDGA
jgi:phage shock protein PspC (stress-responsive transcriptional regulator)